MSPALCCHVAPHWGGHRLPADPRPCRGARRWDGWAAIARQLSADGQTRLSARRGHAFCSRRCASAALGVATRRAPTLPSAQPARPALGRRYNGWSSSARRLATNGPTGRSEGGGHIKQRRCAPPVALLPRACYSPVNEAKSMRPNLKCCSTMATYHIFLMAQATHNSVLCGSE